ncbi:MAG: transglycosylase SLT domain-containing protein [Erythrobacter sp.]
MSLSSQSPHLKLDAASPGMRSAFEAAARNHRAMRQITVSQGGEPLVSAPIGRPLADGSPIEQAIANASRQTGVDFEFLLAQARVESALDPAAKARTSSASGLYQFIESTWLDTMKKHGARFGLGALADDIQSPGNGAAFVADPARRAQILGLRNDPQIASWMAAGLAEDNRAHLLPILGRQPDHGELYLAHFLGAGGAGRFLSALQENPQQSAAALFAKAAAANRPIFYESDGTPRSLAGVMSHLGGKIERAMGLAPHGRSQPVWPNHSSGPSQGYAPAPYLIADEAVFMPLSAPVTSGNRPPPLPEPAARAPLSQVLSATFTAAQSAISGSPRANDQVQRAYQQLRSFGL